MLKRIALLCFLPLLMGAAVYVFFREQGLLGFSINRSYHTGAFWQLLIDTLPDFCWSFSLASALYLFLGRFGVTLAQAFILVAVVIVLSEAIQLFFPERFTFDVKDLLADLLAVFLSTYFLKQMPYEKEKF